MLAPLRRHWYVNGALPAACTPNHAEPPSTTTGGARVGALLAEALKDQFSRLRDGDRLSLVAFDHDSRILLKGCAMTRAGRAEAHAAIAALEPGDTVLVSGAGGAVGTIAGQIASMHGARVVGIVGSQKKADWIINELGYDAAVVRGGDTPLAEAIAAVCSDGVDLFFDNVGGDLLEPVLNHINYQARIPFCGAVADYTAEDGTAWIDLR